MRKGLFFWFTLFLAALVVAGGFLFFGRRPVVGTVADALPKTGAEVPRFLLVAPGNQVGSDFPEALAKEAGQSARPYVRLMEGLLPLVSLSKETALLAAWSGDANAAEMFAAFLFSREEASALSSGRIPGSWAGVLPEASLSSAGRRNRFRLFLAEGIPGMYIATVDRMMLLSLEEAGIEKMLEALKDPAYRVCLSWTLEPHWPGHLFFHDGGVLAGMAALQGRAVGDAPVSFEAAWRKTGENGVLAWSLAGMEGWIRDDLQKRLPEHSWAERVFVPEPLIAAAGFHVPREVASIPEIQAWLLEAATALGVDAGLLGEVIEGPVVVTIGGRSRLLLVNLPGFLVELAGRGGTGRELVDAMWDRHWMRLSLTPKTLEGFETGGTLSVPLTVVGAASEELAVIGAMDESNLKERVRLKDVIGLPEVALGWLFVDFPKAADALENVARAGSLAQKLGVSGGKELEDIALTAEELRQLGTLLVVIEDYKTGRIQWKGALPDGKRQDP